MKQRKLCYVCKMSLPTGVVRYNLTIPTLLSRLPPGEEFKQERTRVHLNAVISLGYAFSTEVPILPDTMERCYKSQSTDFSITILFKH